MTTTATLFSALTNAQADVQAQGKDSTNTFHKYKYTSMEDLLIEARRVLTKHGLAASIDDVTIAFGTPYDSKELDKDGCEITITYRDDVLVCQCTLRHESGEFFSCQRQQYIIPEKGRPPDKALATANTFAIGYWLRDLLLIPRVDDEPDRRDDTKYAPRARTAAPPSQVQPPKREELYKDVKPQQQPAGVVDDPKRIARCRDELDKAQTPEAVLKLMSAVKITQDKGEFSTKTGESLLQIGMVKYDRTVNWQLDICKSESDVQAIVRATTKAVSGKYLDNHMAQDALVRCAKKSAEFQSTPMDEAEAFFGADEGDAMDVVL